MLPVSYVAAVSKEKWSTFQSDFMLEVGREGKEEVIATLRDGRWRCSLMEDTVGRRMKAW
jgi:hypothetical protein